MGFKDLKAFNLALLAKQGSRIQHDSNSLVNKVFKAKYFATSTFMDSQLGSRPSYVWRSVFAAKGIINKGSRWCIGNGREVRVWEDRWIPSQNTFKVVSPRPQDSDIDVVVDLLNKESGSWDANLVTSTFLSHEANTVLSIPISPSLPRTH